MGEAVSALIEEISKKIELRDFPEDVLLTTEEYLLLKEGEIVREERFNELKVSMKFKIFLHKVLLTYCW